MLPPMDYREQAPPAGLTRSVRALWTLDCGAAANETIEHQAIPDGCIELIWRNRGMSSWGGEQPAAFACGLISAPAALRFSGDAHFTALRLWPWAWHRLGLAPAAAFMDGWRPLPAELDGPQSVLARLSAPEMEDDRLAAAILNANSVAEILAATGLSHRQLQRWFKVRVGVPPSRYLRLLRFQAAFAGVQAGDATLAAHAADHGYADQAHMAREFRTLAKASAHALRSKAKGPFV